MRLPILEEIQINTIELDELIAHLKKYRVGSTPLFCNFSKMSRERLTQVLLILEEAFKDMNISPRFPYPFYIISAHKDVDTVFPIYETQELLPKYFQIESKRVTNKEMLILDKINVSKDKINNENVTKRIEDYNMAINSQKIIKTLYKEGVFLEKLLKEMK